MLSDEVRYKLMKLLEANPQLSQRDVARELGISFGKVNYCVRALMRKGWIKASRFRTAVTRQRICTCLRRVASKRRCV